MSAIEELAKLLEESGATMVFRHQDVHAAFIDLNAELARTKAALEIAMVAMKNAHKACYCNRHKGFDYGEKHPTMGISKHGRWLTPKELLSGALLNIKKELGE